MKNVLKELLSTLIYVGIVFLLTFLFITFVMQRTEVSGSSMYPTLHDNDSLLIEKVSYRFSDVNRFDIVVFPYRYGNNEFFIKRVIGLPGETVRIDYDGNIYINDVLLEENYGAEKIEDPGIAVDGITLADDEVFVMGDNRNHSMDSRDPSVGNIKKSNILGHAFVRIYPFDSFGGIK
ncbi:signal peptidase I [Butyrivibrio sp. YAB3001]|uniref:signal peptidase I n=1 Tax=Butyrivibrio sp. YAB3001 TaxID=1520812 RepID=UPI0008F64B67|nr:signal peptidase I [Butyrivibrio sp. YAB3001]SFB68627.1 signal peptidase I [Butyrivibrio sp. YAB3001]